MAVIALDRSHKPDLFYHVAAGFHYKTTTTTTKNMTFADSNSD